MMRSAESPRRPRPGPRPPVVGRDDVGPDPGTVQVDGELIGLPGFAAYLRRNPKLTQRSAVSAIVAGVALFVGAALTTSGASADVAGAKRPMSAATDAQLPSDPGLSIDPAAPVVMRLLTTPTHAKKQAPVSHGVISGLAANGIPKVALNAYRVAAARMANVQPGCGIHWSLLAGIGREESDHGRFGGAVLHSDGVSTPRIMGPALDGVHWDLVPAPANGQAMYGDGKYAHALGPMQFIPSTWAVYGTDATGDGRADVFNINDAALGAARYLCAAGGDLRTHAGQVRAVLAYNHSDEYLAQVLALADAYRHGVSVTGIPVGITSGSLPKVTDTGYIPPANPGAPTAVGGSRPAKPTPSKTPARTSAPATSKAATTTRPGGSTSTSSGGSGSSTSASSTPPSGSTPTPTPSKSCNLLTQILGCKKP